MKTNFLLFAFLITVSANLTLAQTMGGGDGSQGNPYILSNAADWTELRKVVVASSPAGWPYVELANDIDMSTVSNWNVKMGQAFKGVFDGKGYKMTNIKIGNESTPLSMNTPHLFSSITGATIKNLEVNVAFYAAITSNPAYSTAAGLVGFADLTCTIQNCKVNGTVHMSNSGAADKTNTVRVGGIVGFVNNNAVLTIINSSTNLNLRAVSTTTTTTTFYGTPICGGIVGENHSGSKIYIINCSAAGSVYTLSNNNIPFAGGIVGLRPSGSTVDFQVINCLASNTVEACNNSTTATTGSRVGGIIGESLQNSGQAIVKNCMALNPSLKSFTYSTTDPTLNRITAKTEWAIFTDNYAKSDMTLTAKHSSTDGINGTAVTITVANDPTDGNGGNLGEFYSDDAIAKLNTYVSSNPTFSGITLSTWSSGGLSTSVNGKPNLKHLDYVVTNGILNVKGVEGSKQLNIYTITGKIFKQLMVTNSYRTTLERGIYILKVEGFTPTKLAVY